MFPALVIAWCNVSSIVLKRRAHILWGSTPQFLPKDKPIMPSDIRFSEKEMMQLHLLLSQDIENSRVQLHQTPGLPNAQHLQQRMGQSQILLKKLDDALPMFDETATIKD